MIDENTRAVFGRSYAAEPDVLVKELALDEAIEAADTLLLTIPSQLGVDYNAHLIGRRSQLRGTGARLALTSHVGGITFSPSRNRTEEIGRIARDGTKVVAGRRVIFSRCGSGPHTQ